MNQHALFMCLALLLASCSSNGHKDEALAAHNTAEKVKDTWSKVSKPLEIEVVDRSKEELEAIGSIAVWFDGIEGDKAVRFNFDGEVFKPSTPVMADSTVLPRVCYPYQMGLQPGDTIKVADSQEGRLVGRFQSFTQTDNKITVRMQLQDITALLRLKLQSDNINDILQSASIHGDGLAVAGLLVPLRGEWIEAHGASAIASSLSDCLFNNGFSHDFHLIPTEQAGDVVIQLNVNGKVVSISTTLPPLRVGSITELRLTLNNGKLNVGSSWVDTKHPFEKPAVSNTDSIKVGYILQKDGSITASAGENALAWVIQSNGKHGKAIALLDNNACNAFGKQSFKTGHVFATADGKLCEGYFGSQEHANDLVFSPRIKYPDAIALGFDNGAQLTQAILHNAEETAYKTYCDKRVLASGYIPSLAEMAKFAYFLNEHEGKLPNGFKPLEGIYATSSESGEETFYSIDMSEWFITAHNSKEHNGLKTRLFYLF